MIGVNTAIIGPGGGSAGIGFAVPINSVSKAVGQLIRYGRVIRPTLGIGGALDRNARELGISGVIVLSVYPGSGAEEAGMQGVQRAPDGQLLLGDVIVAMDEFPVEDSDDLLNALEQHKPGDVVEVTTLRGGEEKKLRVRLSAPE